MKNHKSLESEEKLSYNLREQKMSPTDKSPKLNTMQAVVEEKLTGQKPTSFLNSEDFDACSEESSVYEDKESECLTDDDYSDYSNDTHSVDDSMSNTYEDLLALDEAVKSKGLSESEIKKFPTYIYLSSDSIAKPDACCVICISSFEVGEIVREISCSHEFHRDCIDKWFSNSVKCPSCNKKLISS